MTPGPEHVAIVMAGSERWAQLHALSGPVAEAALLQAARRLLAFARSTSIRYLTLCPDDELPLTSQRQEQLDRLATGLRSDIAELGRGGIQVELCRRTGRQELVEATRALAQRLQSRSLRPATTTATERTLESELESDLDPGRLLPLLGPQPFPAPDLVVLCGRTDHKRLTEYLLFSTAYAEFHFSPALWPEFAEADLERALADYSQRQRRFGKTAEQLLPSPPGPNELPSTAPPRPLAPPKPTAVAMAPA